MWRLARVTWRCSSRRSAVTCSSLSLPITDVSLKLDEAAGVRLGNATGLAGRVTAAGAPQTGRTVRLEVRAHPFDGDWKERASAVTGADGTYAFAPRLQRNHRVRVRLDPLPDGSDAGLSPSADAYVLPAFTLSFRSRDDRVDPAAPGLHGPARGPAERADPLLRRRRASRTRPDGAPPGARRWPRRRRRAGCAPAATSPAPACGSPPRSAAASRT